MDRDYAAANREQARAKSRAWSAQNKDRKKAADKAAYLANKAARAARSKAYRERTAPAIVARRNKYAVEHREIIRERNRQYRLKNRGRILADRAFRKAAKRQATPPWLTSDHRAAIRAFYQAAVELELLTGVKHHVDHIFPLRGRRSCGLHVPWNLQVLPASANLRKSNREP